MKKHSRINLQNGQTLITFLIFIVMGITITTAATMILMNSSLNASKVEVGTSALHVAESGVENALLRLIRDPTYTGETLSVGEGTAVVVVSGSSPLVVTSTGRVGNNIRKIQVSVGYTNGILAVTPPWREIQ